MGSDTSKPSLSSSSKSSCVEEWDHIALVSPTSDREICLQIVEERVKRNRVQSKRVTSHDSFGDAMIQFYDTNDTKALILLVTSPTMHFLSTETPLLSLLDGEDHTMCFVDFIIESIGRFVGNNRGVWICEYDSLIVGLSKHPIQSVLSDGVQVFCVPSENGVHVSYDEESKAVEGFFSSGESIPNTYAVAMTYISPKMTKSLVDVLIQPHFHICTSLGEDSGEPASHVHLYYDFLELLGTNASMDAYEFDTRSDIPVVLRSLLFEILGHFSLTCVLLNDCSRIHPVDCKEYWKLQIEPPQQLLDECHAMGYFEDTRSTRVFRHSMGHRPSTPTETKYPSLTDNEEDEETEDRNIIRYGSIIKRASFVSIESDSACLTNSVLLGSGVVETNAFIENCKLTGNWRIGHNAVCINLSLFGHDTTVPPGVVFQEVRLRNCASPVLLFFHIDDDRYAMSTSGTFLKQSWTDVMKRTGLTTSDLWYNIKHAGLYTAKLFPVQLTAQDESLYAHALYYVMDVIGQVAAFDMESGTWLQKRYVSPLMQYQSRRAWMQCTRISLAEIEHLRNTELERASRLHQTISIDEFRFVRAILSKGNHVDELELCTKRLARHRQWSIFATLDQLCTKRCTDESDVKRVLEATGDLLVAFGQEWHGPKFVPEIAANNPDFAPAFRLLQESAVEQAVTLMANLRTKWISLCPDARTFYRLARHYYRATEFLSQPRLTIQSI